jgi:transcriptional regulator with XRE-family HTH domain
MTIITHENLRAFSEQLKTARERAGLTQHDLAKELIIKEGLSLTDSNRIRNICVVMSGWENKKSIPNGITIIRLQQILKTVFVLD